MLQNTVYFDKLFQFANFQASPTLRGPFSELRKSYRMFLGILDSPTPLVYAVPNLIAIE